MTNKLVSIIMPIYNEEKYIEQAIQSIKNQTYTNWELICIDDCSTDKSVEILEKYECDNIKVALLSQNYGSNVARNKGIEIAKGRYIAFLDGDDYYHKEKLEKQVKFLEENNYGITYTGYAMVYKDKKTKNIKVPQKLNYISYMKNTMITTLGVMIDTEKIPKEELYMEDSKLAEDTKTWLRILRKGYRYGIK